jgi:hypothetical protein
MLRQYGADDLALIAQDVRSASKANADMVRGLSPGVLNSYLLSPAGTVGIPTQAFTTADGRAVLKRHNRFMIPKTLFTDYLRHVLESEQERFFPVGTKQSHSGRGVLDAFKTHVCRVVSTTVAQVQAALDLDATFPYAQVAREIATRAKEARAEARAEARPEEARAKESCAEEEAQSRAEEEAQSCAEEEARAEEARQVKGLKCQLAEMTGKFENLQLELSEKTREVLKLQERVNTVKRNTERVNMVAASGDPTSMSYQPHILRTAPLASWGDRGHSLLVASGGDLTMVEARAAVLNYLEDVKQFRANSLMPTPNPVRMLHPKFLIAFVELILGPHEA